MAFVYWLHLPEHTDMFTEGYIGFTSNTVKKRLKTHFSDMNREKCYNYPLYNNLRKYGDSIVVDTLVQGSTEYCLDIEYKLRNSPKIGWNLLVGGQKGSLGVKASEETRKKFSESRKGEGNSFYGKEHSEETKQKISKAKKGKSLWTEEQKLEFSRKRTGKKHNLSDEQRAAMSKRARERVASEETKKKISDAAKARNNRAWRSTVANRAIWSLAVDAFEMLRNNPTTRQAEVAKTFGLEWGTIRSVFLKVRSGWNPSEDSEYLEWLRVYKEQNEKE